MPCRAGDGVLTLEQARAHRSAVPDWELVEGEVPRLRRQWVLRDFAQALAWIQAVAAIAEQQDHHPDLHLTSWNHVTIEVWTHAVGGLHPNDFVLARLVDRAWERRTTE